MKAINSLLNKYFWAILGALALIFFLSVAAAASWGLPALWHADEVLYQVMPALDDGLDAITLNIFYPTLPLFSMIAAGKVFSLLTADELLIMSGMRLISAVLAALVIVLSALMTLTAGRSRTAALIAAALVMFSSGFITIAHHALVDVYLTFFVALAAFLLLRFVATQKDIWLYLGFFAIGLAASSKYNGISLLLAATLMPLLFGGAHWRSDLPRLAGRMLLAYFLAFLGFFIGTPRAVLNGVAHLEQLAPSLARQRVYAGPRPIGLIGQWDRMLDGLGPLLFLLFALALLWAVIQAARFVWVRIKQRKIGTDGGETFLRDGRFYLALLLIFFAFELPIALSQFYPMRYMVPAYALLAVLSAMMVDDLWRSFQRSGNQWGRGILALGVSAVILFSGLRYVSVILLYANDSRIVASDALPQMIPPGSRTEYTLYPPHLPQEERVVDNYPLKVFKFEEDIAEFTGWNMGEEGVESRRPDYLVVDRKTYERFDDAYVCRLNPVECRFFSRLLGGETNYELSRAFEYRVPPYLPQMKTDYANIEVLLFERRAEAERPDAAAWQNALNAQFGQDILLHGYDIGQTTERQTAVTLFWSTGARLAENYKAFVHCLDGEGQIVSQSDSVPAGGSAPTAHWLRDEIIKDEHLLELPQGSSDTCRLQVGLYASETGERLSAVLDGAAAESGAVQLQNGR